MPKRGAKLRRAALAVLAAWGCCLGLPGPAGAEMAASLNIKDEGGGEYTFSWGSLIPPVVAAACTGQVTSFAYTVCDRRVLFNTSLASDRDLTGTQVANGGFTPGTCRRQGAGENLSLNTGIIGAGSICADVFGVATVTSDNCASATSIGYTGTSCHNFVHPTIKPAEGFGFRAIPHVARADSTGGQLGFGQEWTFKYALDNDATATFKIFGPGVTFPAADAQGFTDQPTFAAANPTCTYSPPPATNSVAGNSGPDCPVKTLIDQIARPGENFSLVLNQEVWDLRDSSGSVVPNGIYSLWGSFTDVRDNSAFTNDQTPAHISCPPNCPSNTLAFRGYLTSIPVDVLRIMNLKTVGITQAGQKASITYDMTGNATVREVIGKPGTRFMIDTAGACGPAGFIQAQKVFCKVAGEAACAGFPPLTPLPGPVCEDPNLPAHGVANILDNDALIISTLTFNHNSGVGIVDQWNGSVYEKTQVSTPGVYNLAISAIDGYGNRAVDQNGNDGPILSTLIYDVTPAAPTPDTTPPTISNIVVHCTNGDQDLGSGPSSFNVKTCSFPGAFNGVTVSVTHNKTGETLGTFSVSVSGPGGAVAGPAPSSPDSTNTINFNPTATEPTPGTYTISYSICDQSNNCVATPSPTFIIGTAAALPPPTVSSVTVGSTLISSGSVAGAFASIIFTLATTTGTSAGFGANLSAVAISYSSSVTAGAVNLGGSVSASGQVVTWSTNTVVFATGTYYAAITPKDSNGTAGAFVSLPFVIPAQPPPTISTITVGSTLIPLAATVDPFSSLNFVLSPAPGNVAGANSTVVVRHFPTLDSPGIDLGGVVSAVGNTVTWSTSTLISSTGTYTVLVVAQDSAGNVASPFGIAFGMTPPAAPTVQEISVGATVISLSGGTAVNSFTTINFILATTTGTIAGGANLSTVTVQLGGASIQGTLSATGQVVTWTANATVSSTGTYSLSITPKDSLGTAGTPVGTTFVITGSASGGGGATMTQDAFKAAVVPFPNPSAGGPVAINFTVAAQASVDFDLYTLAGQRVFHQTQSYAAGAQTFNWNLVNQNGNKVSSGVYMLRITANDGQNILRAGKKVMILR